MSGMFSTVMIFLTAGFAVVAIIIVVSAAGNVIRWKKDNAVPIRTADATVAEIRTDLHRLSETGADSTRRAVSEAAYYAVFEVAGGGRMKFEIDIAAYETLTAGDKGRLTFQGIRYLGFERSEVQ